ncbi:hypothetical protein CDAR_568701 [Caerostris darwini]|uniref:Reverse transcriptase domain-containing protein n=1 Tax=Caerostris darwini TaxID=1538125 RepID=A0AAV4SR31_9ARAC|nr:hypothetical protein CDAR_568701 [Caerostris darwini]
MTLNKITSNKSPGIDNIHGELKEIYFANRSWFGRLLNFFVKEWKIPHFMENSPSGFNNENWKMPLTHPTIDQFASCLHGGSCLGPALWNIFINDRLVMTLESGVNIQAFADDLIIMIKEKAPYFLRKLALVL